MSGITGKVSVSHCAKATLRTPEHKGFLHSAMTMSSKTRSISFDTLMPCHDQYSVWESAELIFGPVSASIISFQDATYRLRSGARSRGGGRRERVSIFSGAPELLSSPLAPRAHVWPTGQEKRPPSLACTAGRFLSNNPLWLESAA